MLLVPINIPTFRFSPSKVFVQLLVPIKFSITIFVPIFKLVFIFLNEIVQKCVEYCIKNSQKNLEFFNKTHINYNFFNLKKYKNSY